MPRYFLSLTAALLLITASGCVGHHPAVLDPGVLPGAFTGNGGPASITPERRWWSSLGDHDLDELIGRALAQSPDLDQAYARLAAAEAAERAIGGQGQPQVNLAGSLSRDRQPGLSRANEGSNYRLSLAASYELDLWDKFGARSRAATIDRQAARAQLATLYLGLTARIADAYFLATALHEQIDIQEKQIASLSDTVALIDNRYREGIAPAADLYQARETLTGAQAKQPTLVRSLALAENTLAVLVGDFPGTTHPTSTRTLPDLTQAWPTGLPADLLTNRPDIRAAAMAVAARDQRLAAALADRFPSFNLLTSYGLAQSSLTQTVVGTFLSVAAGLAAPVVDGGRRVAEIDRNQALVDESLAFYRQTVLDAFKEVENALVASRTTEQRLLLLQEQLATASTREHLIRDSYYEGLSTAPEVLVAFRQLSELKIELITARRQLISDRISLIRALGGTWPETEIAQRLQSPHSDTTTPGETP